MLESRVLGISKKLRHTNWQEQKPSRLSNACGLVSPHFFRLDLLCRKPLVVAVVQVLHKSTTWSDLGIVPFDIRRRRRIKVDDSRKLNENLSWHGGEKCRSQSVDLLCGGVDRYQPLRYTHTLEDQILIFLVE
jgi:sigma54-dependent transcription regulator